MMENLEDESIFVVAKRRHLKNKKRYQNYLRNNMILKNSLIIALSMLLLCSCSNNINKALAEIQNMPTPDYNYVVQPVYSTDKKSLEFKIKELYSSEEVKIGAIGTHGYDKETKTQKDEKYWFQVVLLNSKSIVDFKNESKMDKLGKEVAKSVISEITNIDKYDKIQVTFVVQWNDGMQKQMKQNIFYTLPELEVNDLSEKNNDHTTKCV